MAAGGPRRRRAHVRIDAIPVLRSAAATVRTVGGLPACADDLHRLREMESMAFAARSGSLLRMDSRTSAWICRTVSTSPVRIQFVRPSSTDLRSGTRIASTRSTSIGFLLARAMATWNAVSKPLKTAGSRSDPAMESTRRPRSAISAARARPAARLAASTSSPRRTSSSSWIETSLRRAANVKILLERHGCHPANDRTHAVHDLDEPLGLERLQGFADYGSADTELCGELGLGAAASAPNGAVLAPRRQEAGRPRAVAGMASAGVASERSSSYRTA